MEAVQKSTAKQRRAGTFDMLMDMCRNNAMASGNACNPIIFELQAEISKTLAHPTRLAILHLLKEGEKTVNELTETLGTSQSNISQHLALMRQRRIVKTRKTGATVYYRLSSPKIAEACDIVREVLMEQLRQRQEIAKAYSP